VSKQPKNPTPKPKRCANCNRKSGMTNRNRFGEREANSMLGPILVCPKCKRLACPDCLHEGECCEMTSPKPKPAKKAGRGKACALTFADVDRSALRIVKGLPTVEAEARNDVRSSPAYWNGDDWESISGSHDAREWMDQQLAQYVSKEILKLLNPPL